MLEVMAVGFIILLIAMALVYANRVSRSNGVDEYEISITEEEFPVVQLLLKLDDNRKIGPLEFAPAFAHTLSDELCTASAMATKRNALYPQGTELKASKRK